MPVIAFILVSLISSIVARVLLGAGLTFFTYTWVNDVLDDLIIKAQTSLNTLPEFAISMIRLWNLDVCFSMVLSTIQIIIFVRIAKVFVGKSS